MAQESRSSRQTGSTVGHVVRRGLPIAVLIVVVIAAALLWRGQGAAPRHEAAPHPQDPVPVSAVAVRKETVPIQMRFLGQTEASKLVEIRARVAGYLGEWTFKEGERVEAGQKLFQIDPRPFEVQLAQARAQLASAQARLNLANFQLRRIEELRSTDAASAVELEEWQSQAAVAQAEVQEANARIDAAALELSYTSIEAPITGMIGQALKDTGSYVDAGANGLLAVVQQVDPMYVSYAVTEREVLRYRRQLAEHQIIAPGVDQVELEITLADGSIYPYRGRINFVDVQVDETTGTSLVRGQVPNPEGLLKPGQFIYASVLGIERVDVIRVPQRAITQSPAGATVLVVNDQNVAESRPVVLGEWSGTEYWIIERGLEEGDRVIVDRLMMVRPGIPVRLTQAVPPGESSDAVASGQNGESGVSGERFTSTTPQD